MRETTGSQRILEKDLSIKKEWKIERSLVIYSTLFKLNSTTAGTS